MNHRHFYDFTLSILAVMFFVQTANARFRQPELEETPIARLTENLAKQAEADQKDVNVRFNLARTHAMAYALKTDKAKVWKSKEINGAWFSHTPSHVPFVAQPTDDEEKLKAAQSQLDLAIKRYAEVIKLQPDHLPAQLGHAWCLDQAGKDMQAMDEYRKIIELGWAKEKDMTTAGIGWHSIVAETSQYLIPLLDKERNADELASIDERVKQLRRIRRPITPIAIPLRDGMTLSDLEDKTARVRFDADGSGEQKTWTWISKDAGWLVYDQRASGQVTSALQMFGNVTFWLFWDNGYQALASLDDNHDGQVSGRELEHLAIWQDENCDGISQPGEVRTLKQWGITSLSCEYTHSGARTCDHCEQGVTFIDGTTRATYDLILQQTK